MKYFLIIRLLLFKIYFATYRVYLYLLFNLDHKLYMDIYIKFLKRIGVVVNGKPNYINFNVKFDSTDNYSLIELNDHCVVTGNSLILTHDYSISHMFIGSLKRDPHMKRKGKVIIGENAFVGANCIILPGCNIGKNSVVGAGSVVTKDVPDNTIVAGNPARKVKTIEEYVDSYSKILNEA